MFSVLDHTTKTEEILVKQPSEDIQTSSKPIPKPRKTKRDETTRNKTADESKTKLHKYIFHLILSGIFYGKGYYIYNIFVHPVQLPCYIK
jgi:hypothetical protein